VEVVTTMAAGGRVSILFDGADDYLRIPHNARYNLNKTFTLEAWYNPHALPPPGAGLSIVAKGASGDAAPARQHNYYIVVANSTLATAGRNLVAGFEDGAGRNYQAVYSIAHTLHQWYHVAFVYDATARTLTLYHDGIPVARTTSVAARPQTNADPLMVGRLFSDSAASSFKGSIADVRVWSTARLPTHIYNNYNRRLAGNEFGLVGLWRLDQGSGTTAPDSTSGANPGTLENGARWDHGTPPPPALAFGPLIGHVSSSTARIWASTNVAATLQAHFKRSTDPAFVPAAPAVTTSASNDYTATATIANLQPETSYDCKFQVNGWDQAASFARFTTAPVEGRPSRFSFAFGADIRYSYAPHVVFDRITAQHPSFALLTGDLIYIDDPSTEDSITAYRGRWKENWGEAKLRKFLKSFPVYLMWDDHEIIDDWSAGKTGRWVNASRAFSEYAAGANPAPRVPGAFFYSFSKGQADFYVFDTRTYRSPNSAADNASKTMLGSVQKQDLKAWLLASRATFKFLVSTVPWNDFATTGADSWHGFTTERAELYEFIRANGIEGVVLLSGDQHYIIVNRLTAIAPDFTLYEFSPTPLNASLRAAPTSSDPQILFKRDQVKNYGFFTVDTTTSPATIEFRAYDLDNAVVFTRTISERDTNLNTAPRVTIQERPPASVSGDWDIHCTLVDPDNQPLTVHAEYSTDGTAWRAATLSQASVGAPGPTVVTWQTATDLPQAGNPRVYLRLRASDGAKTGFARYLGDTFTPPGVAVAVTNA
jgi:phosphodiesterase/alkaline phosphatase D-like protein